MRAWGGIAGLGLGLSLIWTGVRERRLLGVNANGEAGAEKDMGTAIGRVVRWMSLETARHAGLEGRKGAIREGLDADFVVWDPEAEFEVRRWYCIAPSHLILYPPSMTHALYVNVNANI